jgi:hypothetical protein
MAASWWSDADNPHPRIPHSLANVGLRKPTSNLFQSQENVQKDEASILFAPPNIGG